MNPIDLENVPCDSASQRHLTLRGYLGYDTSGVTFPTDLILLNDLSKIEEMQVTLGNHSFYFTILLCSVSIHPNSTHAPSSSHENSYTVKFQDRRQDVSM